MKKQHLVIIVSTIDNDNLKKDIEALIGDTYSLLFTKTYEKLIKIIEENYSIAAIIITESFERDALEQFVQEIKTSFISCNISIIYAASQQNVNNLENVIKFGIDDYVVLPTPQKDLILRIELNAERIKTSHSTNPLTLLPGNEVIYRVLDSRLKNKKPLALLYADVDNFKAYNDHYGFEEGDKVLKHTAKIIKQAIKKYDSTSGFVGNIGGDDFVIITKPQPAEYIAKFICKDFDSSTQSFYSETDYKNKGIIVHDRSGRITHVPLMTISIGIVTTENMLHPTYGKISHIAAMLKEYAKTKPSGKTESNFVHERRHE